MRDGDCTVHPGPIAHPSQDQVDDTASCCDETPSPANSLPSQLVTAPACNMPCQLGCLFCLPAAAGGHQRLMMCVLLPRCLHMSMITYTPAMLIFSFMTDASVHVSMACSVGAHRIVSLLSPSPTVMPLAAKSERIVASSSFTTAASTFSGSVYFAGKA